MTRVFSIFGLLLLSYIIVNFLCLPHNHIISHPLYMDDYKFFTYSFQNASFERPRPLMFFFAPLLAKLGSLAYPVMLLGDVILPALTVFFLEKFLFYSLKPIHILCYGLILFSFPFILDVSKFLGLYINLTSNFFGLISLITLLIAHRKNEKKYFMVSGLFYLLTLFTKEDFILPNFILLFYLLLCESPQKSNRISLSLYALWMIFSITGLALYNTTIAHSVFTNSHTSTSPYFVNIHPLSLMKTTWNYLTSHSYLSLLTATGTLIILLCILSKDKKNKFSLNSKLFTISGIIFGLLAPYAVLPNHFNYFYIFNWLPLETGFILFGYLCVFGKHMIWLQNLILFIFALICMGITFLHREASAFMYEKEAAINRNIIKTLQMYRNLLNKETWVGVTGPGIQGLSPFAICQGEYLQTVLKLTPHWIFFTDNPSNGIQTRFDASLQINTLSSNKINEFNHIKFIYFEANGKGEMR